MRSGGSFGKSLNERNVGSDSRDCPAIPSPVAAQNYRQYQTRPQTNDHHVSLPRNQPQFGQIQKEKQEKSLADTVQTEDRSTVCTSGQLTTRRGQMSGNDQLSQPVAVAASGKKPRVEQTIPSQLTGLRVLTGRVGKVKEWMSMVMY